MRCVPAWRMQFQRDDPDHKRAKWGPGAYSIASLANGTPMLSGELRITE